MQQLLEEVCSHLKLGGEGERGLTAVQVDFEDGGPDSDVPQGVDEHPVPGPLVPAHQLAGLGGPRPCHTSHISKRSFYFPAALSDVLLYGIPSQSSMEPVQTRTCRATSASRFPLGINIGFRVSNPNLVILTGSAAARV